MAPAPTPLHRRLWVVVAAGLLPTAALSVVAIVLLQHQQRDEVARATIETMRAMVSAVDGELENTVVVAETLAASEALDSRSLSVFYEEAKRVLARHANWVTIELSTPDGRQVLDLMKGLGETLPSLAARESFRHVLATGKPAIGSLVVSEGAPPGFSVRVPVSRRGSLSYVLSVVVSPDSLQEVIRRQRVPQDGVVSIFDAQGIHVARSRLHEKYLGHPGSPSLQQLTQAQREGWGPSVTLEGQSIYAAFSRSAISGWSVAVGIPAHEIDGGMTQSLFALGFGALLSLVLGALASAAMARTITKPIIALRNAAQAVGRGELPELAQMKVAEVDEVARALVSAARARGQAELAREELLERERNAREAAEQANRSKDEFLAMLGHELRNPLSAISNAARVLEFSDGQRPLTLAASEQAQRIIRRQVDHLAHLVDDLLDVARVVRGKVSLDKRPVELRALVERAANNLEAAGSFADHQIEVQAEPVWVSGDATRLEQVVNNLLLNAVKYSPNGSRVQISVGTENSHAVLRVRDQGVGIEPSLLPRVFELFAQGKQPLARSQGGLGIGLTLVHSLVKRHGGSVIAQSDGPGKGSQFTVQLPRIPAPDAAETSPQPAPQSSGRRVLIVEDNQDAREMLQALLELRGHSVRVAADGPQGVEQAFAAPPDVAFVDLGLPGFDGFEVARRLRSQAATQATFLVALSGYGSDRDRQASRAAGFDLHVVKPVGSDTLNQILERDKRMFAPNSAAVGETGES